MSELPPIELIAYAADKLGILVADVVFLGGAVVGLLVTDPVARPPRVTKDVDVAIEVSNLIDYYDLDKKLLAKGFTNDLRGPMCRYLHGLIMIDVMPIHPKVLGFSNRWYPLALATANQHKLANGITIKLISAACFLGTKLEAFSDPKREEHHNIFTSRDFADVVRVIDGRSTIVDEVFAAPSDLRDFLREQSVWILHENYLEEAIAEHVDADREDLVVERLNAFAAP
jgi:hypothetical protein